MLLLGIIVCAAIVRFVLLGSIPPGLFIDEVWSSYGPQAFHQGLDPHRWPIPLFASQLVTGQLFTYRLAGDSVFWTRFSTAVLGVVAIPLIFALAKYWFSSGTALLSALGMALAPWPVQLSRYAVPGSALVAYLIAMMICLEMTLARRRAGWVVGVALSIIAVLSTHAVAKIFLPAFLLAYAVVRRHEIMMVLRDVLGWVIGAAGLVVGYGIVQGLALLRPDDPSSVIQSSLLSNFAFSRGLTWHSLEGVLTRYASHWGPQFLLIHGDPNLKYSIGFGGELGVLTPFAFVGLVDAWRHRRHVVARTLLLWAVLWPLPSALVISDNPNAVRSALGLPLLLLLSARGLRLTIAWTGDLLKRKALLRNDVALGSAVCGVGCALTLFFYFFLWPVRPGVPAAFDYGYRQATEALEMLPRRSIVISDVWRAQDMLAFFGLRRQNVVSIAPGSPPTFDAFRSGPGYFLTSDPARLRLLHAFGYDVRLLELIRTPTGEPRLWIAAVNAPHRVSPAPTAKFGFMRPNPKFAAVTWNPANQLVTLKSTRVVVGESAVGYAVAGPQLFGEMRLTAYVSPPRGLHGDVMMGFSSYRDPTLGAPDHVSPFMGVFFRIRRAVNGTWTLIAEDRSVDSRQLRRPLTRARGPFEIRVTYDYLDSYRATFEIRKEGRWILLLRVNNYVKEPLHAFIGLLSPNPATASVSVRRLEFPPAEGVHGS
jgi:hypothetical protein